MKKLTILGIVSVVVVMALALTMPTLAGNGNDCATIKDGTILDAVNDEQVVLGYDQFGYNYQAHLFVGRYCDYDRVVGGDQCDVRLMMKWNDAWLSNKSCDSDAYLDRHFGYDTYIGSGAWLTNHQLGLYTVDGKEYYWSWFIKIVAVPTDAYVADGTWYAGDDTEIGPAIWGSFAIIESINDPDAEHHGVDYLSAAPAGFGFYAP